ncbi:MAG: hypothetical protein PHH98_01310 [Candidatus Gracilibacteria bacterium]|nr:hypothetical protein [Candidatus Gracilibacteria bacterium]
MKKILLILLLFFTFFSNTFAYNPTSNELNLISNFKDKVNNLSKVKGELWLKRNIISIENFLKVNKNERTNFLLGEILTDMNEVLSDLKIKNEEQLQKQLQELENQKQEQLKQSKDYNEKAEGFFEIYGKDITTSLEINDKCTKYFDFVDEIAKKNDFPTELIIATWSKESNCNLSNPANGWGPFQITSKYYTPGDITLEEFGEYVQTYIDFTKGKWNYFNNNTYHNYKSRFGSENIAITYDNYTLRDLKLSAILYNGVSKDTTLDGNTFANSNLNNNVTTNSDGLVTRFLKILNWRTKNK